MASRTTQAESRTSAKKKSSGTSSRSTGSTSRSGGGTGARMLRNVVTSAAATETLIDLVDRLGLVDVLLGRVKARIEETDIDELLEEVTDYLRRNPEVLVVSLGAVTVATGLLVWLNKRREWDGNERRGTGKRAAASSRTRRSAREEEEESSSDDEW